MKKIAVLSLALSVNLFSLHAFAQASESSKSQIISGKIIKQDDCAESGLAIKVKKGGKEYCLGFNSEAISASDLKVGNSYTLGGELTEDGFFPNEFLD